MCLGYTSLAHIRTIHGDWCLSLLSWCVCCKAKTVATRRRQDGYFIVCLPTRKLDYPLLELIYPQHSIVDHDSCCCRGSWTSSLVGASRRITPLSRFFHSWLAVLACQVFEIVRLYTANDPSIGLFLFLASSVAHFVLLDAQSTATLQVIHNYQSILECLCCLLLHKKHNDQNDFIALWRTLRWWWWWYF